MTQTCDEGDKLIASTLIYILSLFITSGIIQGCGNNKGICIFGYILAGILTLMWMFYVKLHKTVCKPCLKITDNTVSDDLIV